MRAAYPARTSPTPAAAATVERREEHAGHQREHGARGTGRPSGGPTSGRRRFRNPLAIAVALLAVAGLMLVPAGVAAASDITTNGGFESGDLQGWSCSSGADVVTSPVRSGTYALAASPTSSDNARCTQTVSVQPGSSYTLSAWVRGSYVYLGATGTGTGEVSTWTPSASSWQQLSTTFTTGPSTESVTIYLHGWYGQPTYHADDVTLSGPPGDGDGGGGDEPQAPAQPTDVSVTGTTSSSVSLEWTTPSGTVSGYRIYRDGTRATTTTDTSATVSSLQPSTTYTFSVTAYNSAGESQHSAQVQATTDASSPPGGGGDLPRHTLTGYWHNFLNGSTALEISDVPTSYDVIAVAFGVGGDQPGEVTFSLDDDLQAALGGYSKAEFISDIETKQDAGKTVILSVGGAKARIDLEGPQGATNFANSVYGLMQEYGFDGVDIDLEGTFDPDLLASALHQLADLAGDDLVLTMAPQTLYVQPGRIYLQLIEQTSGIITTVHTQYYNSGSMNGCDGSVVAQGDVDFMTAQACILLGRALDADQVAFGLPAQPQAAGSGYVDPSLIKDALDCMAYGTSCGDFQPDRTYPGIRGVMTWSINWDAANGYAFANSVAPYLDTLP